MLYRSIGKNIVKNDFFVCQKKNSPPKAGSNII